MSAFVEGALSVDAARWVEHHLEACAGCRARLAEERSFLRQLSSQPRVAPPSDFAAAVMARVAQYPAYEGRIAMPWRRLVLWAAGAAAILIAIFGIVGWAVVTSAPVEEAEAADVAWGVAAAIDFAGEVYVNGRRIFEFALQTGATVMRGFFALVRGSGLGIQLTLLLTTVALNYFFTRLVLNYQRRHQAGS